MSASGLDPADVVTTLPSIPDPVPPPQCDGGDLDTAAAAAGHLTRAAAEAVRELRPDVRLVANAVFPAGTPRGPLEFHQTVEPAHLEVSACDARAFLQASAVARAPLGEGDIEVGGRPACFSTLGAPCAETGSLDRTRCAEVTGPHGEKILTEAFEFDNGTREHQVQVIRADGTWLRIRSKTFTPTTNASGVPTASAPPFTIEQLMAIGTDPAMTLFP